MTEEEFRRWRDNQKLRPMAKKPAKGYAPNPLLAKGRNDPCLCGSGQKWKRCCLPHMPLYIPDEEVEQHKAWLHGRVEVT
jgi:hypothetical protein